MSVNEEIKKHFDKGGDSGSCGKAFEIARAYAASANADPKQIPGLFHDLVTLFSTGEIPTGR